MRNKVCCGLFILANVLFGQVVFASEESTGPKGINSTGLGLTGNGVGIGQIEPGRPGDPKNDSLPGPPDFDTTASLFNSNIDPERVFFTTVSSGVPSYAATANASSETNVNALDIKGHATMVAGVMIGTDTTPMGNDSVVGVAPQADLFSTGFRAFNICVFRTHHGRTSLPHLRG